MAEVTLRANYKLSSTFAPIYSGGPVCFDEEGREGFFSVGESLNHVDLRTGTIIASLPVKGDVEAIAFHSSSRVLVVCGSSHLVSTFLVDDMSQGSSPTLQRQWKGHQQPVDSVAFHPSGAYIATASVDRTACVWDVKQGFCTHRFKDHEGMVTLARYDLLLLGLCTL